MRTWITCIVTALTIGAALPAIAQIPAKKGAFVDRPETYWVEGPRPDVFGYRGMGITMDINCVDYMLTAGAPTFQHGLVESAKRAPVRPDIAALGAALNKVGMAMPFLETAAMDRRLIIMAREKCGESPRAAPLAPALLRGQLAKFAAATPDRTSICGPMASAAMGELRRKATEMKAYTGGFNIQVVQSGYQTVDAVTEVIGDLTALCPQISTAPIATGVAGLRAALEPGIARTLNDREFLDSVARFMKSAEMVVRNISETTEGNTQSACETVLMSQTTLEGYAHFAVAPYLAQKATAREKAAFALIPTACMKSLDAVKAAIKAYPL